MYLSVCTGCHHILLLSCDSTGMCCCHVRHVFYFVFWSWWQENRCGNAKVITSGISPISKAVHLYLSLALSMVIILSYRRISFNFFPEFKNIWLRSVERTYEVGHTLFEHIYEETRKILKIKADAIGNKNSNMDRSHFQFLFRGFGELSLRFSD